MIGATDGVLPAWAQIILGLAAVVTALGVLWTKVLKPGAKLISTTEEMLPLLRNLTIVFRNTPDSFAVLHDIAAQFRTNSGSSLRDLLNRVEATALESRAMLETAARELRESDSILRVGVETARQLADQDRETNRQLMLQVDRLASKLDLLTASGVTVAENLTAREKKVDEASAGVASNLAADKARADEATGPTGAAADAAATPTRQERREAEDQRRAQWEKDNADEATGESGSTGGTPTGEDEG